MAGIASVGAMTTGVVALRKPIFGQVFCGNRVRTIVSNVKAEKVADVREWRTRNARVDINANVAAVMWTNRATGLSKPLVLWDFERIENPESMPIHQQRLLYICIFHVEK